jgi:hypothetical protein
MSSAMNKEKRTIADEIKELPDGTMEVTITFDPFTHGHELGQARNYDPKKYKFMVENPKTQMHIKNGYAIGGYTHDIRNSNGTLKSTDEFGNKIIPALKTLSMEWIPTGNGYGLVRHKQRIANNKIGKEIQELIKAGIGGFSSAHNLKTGDFFGFDYVALPNFTTNRVIVDNSCKNGMCNLNFDEVVNDIDKTLKEEITAYLDSLGVDYTQNEINSLIALEKEKESYKNNLVLLDKIEETKKTIQHDLEYKKVLQDEFQNFINNDYKHLLAQLDDLGFEVNEDKEIIPTEKAFGNIFKPATLEDKLKTQLDSIKTIKLKKVK